MSFFSPILNRRGVGEGGEKVNIDSLSLISIGGFFLFFWHFVPYKGIY